jgi:hypothetical protein
MDRRELLLGASALGLVTNLNLNHPLIAQVGNAVMGRPVCPKCGKCHLSPRERAGLRGPVKTCSDLSDLIGRGIESINTDYSPDGRLLGYRLPTCVVSGGSLPHTYWLLRPDVTYEFTTNKAEKRG